jgi:hypothetical protein
MGAHVATMPPAVLKQMYNHPLTDKGLAAFLADWQKTGSRSSEPDPVRDRESTKPSPTASAAVADYLRRHPDFLTDHPTCSTC